MNTLKVIVKNLQCLDEVQDQREDADDSCPCTYPERNNYESSRGRTCVVRHMRMMVVDESHLPNSSLITAAFGSSAST